MDNFKNTHEFPLSTPQLEKLNYKDPSWMAVYRLLCLYNQFPDPYKIIKQIDHCHYFQKVITPDNMTSILSVYGFRVLYCENIDFSIAKNGTYGLYDVS